MTDILILTLGLIFGFLSSSPPGTINLWISNQTLNHRKESVWFLCGIIVADCTYASLAVWGYYSLIEGTMIEKAILAIGALCVIVMGVMTLLTKSKEAKVDLTMSAKPLQQFALGLLMCGGNPTFLVFWIFAVGVLEERFHLKINGLSLLLFNVGIAIGDYFWFRFLITIVKKFREKITQKYLLLINRVVGVTFMVIGSIALIGIL
jgi:threonine/homoserine/homoserine lactone efflux protein